MLPTDSKSITHGAPRPTSVGRCPFFRYASNTATHISIRNEFATRATVALVNHWRCVMTATIEIRQDRYSARSTEGIRGDLLGAAFRLEILIATSNATIPEDVLADAAERAFPDREALKEFHRAHSESRWPTTCGESRLQHVAAIALAFVAARHLAHCFGVAACINSARHRCYRHLIARFGTPTQVRRFDVGIVGGPAALWPRLLWACQQAALLNEGEASSALVQWYRASDLERRGTARMGSSEAVNHFGGVRAVLVAAKRWRQLWVHEARREGRKPAPTTRAAWEALSRTREQSHV